MSIYAIEYTYDAERSEDMDRIRPSHREYNTTLYEKGVLIAAGPYQDGTPGALILIRASSPQAALAFLDNDPFYKAGVITKRTPREWLPVVGSI